jgi:hypothetical protein
MEKLLMDERTVPSEAFKVVALDAHACGGFQQALYPLDSCRKPQGRSAEATGNGVADKRRSTPDRPPHL